MTSVLQKPVKTAETHIGFEDGWWTAEMKLQGRINWRRVGRRKTKAGIQSALKRYTARLIEREGLSGLINTVSWFADEG